MPIVWAHISRTYPKKSQTFTERDMDKKPEKPLNFRDPATFDPELESVPVMGIRLRKEGEHTVVDAEIGGAWIEVIRERSDGEFCHIVEPAGMFSRYYATPR